MFEEERELEELAQEADEIISGINHQTTAWNLESTEISEQIYEDADTKLELKCESEPEGYKLFLAEPGTGQYRGEIGELKFLNKYAK